MSEFKFSCPNCGQHLAADEGWSGAQIRCPKCESQIVVPRLVAATLAATPAAPSVPAAPPVIAPAAGPKPSVPLAPPDRVPAPPVSALAVVSLVLALLALPVSLVALLIGLPLGLLVCIPAVICGHLALGRLGRYRAFRGGALAKWGLGVGYFSVLLSLISLGLLGYAILAGRHQQGATASARSAPVTPGLNAGSAAAAEGTVPAPNPADSPVTTDPNKVDIPAKAAAGTLYGQPFAVEKAKVAGGVLELAQGKKSLPDADIKIFLFLKPGERLDERSFVISPQSTHGNPHVHLAQRQGGATRGMLTSKYALRLEFEKATGKRIPYKLYFEAPRSYDTLVSGSGTADLQ